MPVCHPDDSELAFSDEAIRGRCGDDDVAFGAALGFAVIAPALRVESATPHGARAVACSYVFRARPMPEPSVPPPRSIRRLRRGLLSAVRRAKVRARVARHRHARFAMKPFILFWLPF